jgi:hypothetical protein
VLWEEVYTFLICSHVFSGGLVPVVPVMKEMMVTNSLVGLGCCTAAIVLAILIRNSS